MEGSGYSGTPLVRKLGLKGGMSVRTFNPPAHYWELVGQSAASLGAASLGDGMAQKADFIHLFSTDSQTLREAFAMARSCMADDGMVWASWPKKSSGVRSQIGRSEVMAAGKKVGLVDVKVCAVDEVWSGLKFVIPREKRQ